MHVTVIDYGIGNLFSVSRALEQCGAQVRVSGDLHDIDAATHLVLPGVGAFADGMQGLRERGMIEPLRRYAASGRPLLGICLGMQMLATVSEEFGEHEGLGLVPGRICPVRSTDLEGRPLKIPHIGWSALSPARDGAWHGTPLAGTPVGAAVYLVHSFHMVPEDPADLLAECRYGGYSVTAAIRRGAVFGCQFHPEKSGPVGLDILKAFVAQP
jgi:imidazole glycerol-phosphate synthase subunit HisH